MLRQRSFSTFELPVGGKTLVALDESAVGEYSSGQRKGGRGNQMSLVITAGFGLSGENTIAVLGFEGQEALYIMRGLADV